ncbi:MAG: hypothetical protein RLZZ162_2300, partial [Verrucomicrobiota bacterium]
MHFRSWIQHRVKFDLAGFTSSTGTLPLA